jgi:hypothetical protein
MMPGVFVLAALALGADGSALPPADRSSSAAAMSVFEVIERQHDLLGRRVVIRGTLSRCQHLSCGLHGTDRNGHDRYLSIGRNPAFDAVAPRHAGRTVEIEARVTDVCLPDVDPDIIALCSDRPGTLADPIFIRVR